MALQAAFAADREEYTYAEPRVWPLQCKFNSLAQTPAVGEAVGTKVGEEVGAVGEEVGAAVGAAVGEGMNPPASVVV